MTYPWDVIPINRYVLFVNHSFMTCTPFLEQLDLLLLCLKNLAVAFAAILMNRLLYSQGDKAIYRTMVQPSYTSFLILNSYKIWQMG